MPDHGGLEPHLYGDTAYFYAEPNPRLSEILVGGGIQGIVYEYTARVTVNYLTRLQARKHWHDQHMGELEGSVRPEVFIGGYKNDRFVGEIHVEAEYAEADEFGRHKPAPGQKGSTTEGHHDLAGALYAELPAQI